MQQQENEKERAISQEELEQIGKERDEYLNGWRRAAADLANYKSDEQARLDDVRRFTKAAILKELLPILDSLDRAIAAHTDKDGLSLVLDQFLAMLKRNGIERIQPKPGDEFDPAIHEAVSEAPVDSPEQVGKIVEVASSGYQLENKILRPANVVLGKVTPPGGHPEQSEGTR